MRPEIIEFDDKLPVKLVVKHIEKTPLKWNNEPQIILVLEGRIIVRHIDFEIELKENDFLILNENEIYQIQSTNEKNKIMISYIDNKFAKAHFKEMNHTILFVNKKEWLCDIEKKETMETDETIKKYIMKIANEINKKDMAYEETVENLVKCLLAYLIEEHTFMNIISEQINISDQEIMQRYERIGGYILSNYKEKISLGEIAKKEHLSMYHLSHEIKNKIGYSFQEILIHLRCEEAIRLLLSTNKKISQIALDCGFSDSKYLNKQIKASYNVSPSQFRKEKMMELDDIYEKFGLHTITDIIKENLDAEDIDKKSYSNIIKRLKIDLEKKSEKFSFSWSESIYLGDVKKILRASCQRSIEELSKNIGFEYIKFYGLFDLIENEEPLYYWYDIDEILHFFNKINIKPFIIFDRIPGTLEKCRTFINVIFTHFIKEYGLEEVNTWKFEIIDSDLYEEIVFEIKKFSQEIEVMKFKKNQGFRSLLYETICIAPYIIHKAIHNESLNNFVKMMDTIKNDIKHNYVFNKERGLISINGFKKPSYYAYYFLSLLGNEILYKGNGYIVTKKEDDLQILLYSYTDLYNLNEKEFLEKEETLLKLNEMKEYILNLTSVNDTYKVTKYKLDKLHGSIYNHWLCMGKPSKLSKEDEAVLHKSVFPEVRFHYIKDKNVEVLEKLMPYEVVLFKLEKI